MNCFVVIFWYYFHLNIHKDRESILYPLINSTLMGNPQNHHIFKNPNCSDYSFTHIRYNDLNQVESKNKTAHQCIQYIRKCINEERENYNKNDQREEQLLLFTQCAKCVSNLICIIGHGYDLQSNHFYPLSNELKQKQENQDIEYCNFVVQRRK